jgi:hypothetical protein
MEGIYCFGGKNIHGISNNDLKFLPIYEPKSTFLHWVYPSCKGVPPAPRHGHTMDYFAKLSSLVIFGG